MASSATLRKQIRASGLTLTEIAARAGIAVTTLHTFMSKKDAEMRASNHQKVAKALIDLTTNNEKATPRRELREEGSAFAAQKHLTVSIPVTSGIEMARELGLDVEAIAANGATEAVRDAARKAFREKYKSQFAAKAAFIEEHGTFAEQVGIDWA